MLYKLMLNLPTSPAMLSSLNVQQCYKLNFFWFDLSSSAGLYGAGLTLKESVSALDGGWASHSG